MSVRASGRRIRWAVAPGCVDLVFGKCEELLVKKPGIAAIGFAGLLALPAVPCEEIAVLSRDAKFMLLDGETLALRDVGNLRWRGVWGVDAVVAGSSSKRFAFATGKLKADLTREHDSGFSQRGALVVTTNVTEENDTWSGTAISYDYGDFSVGDALWVEGTDQLLVYHRERSRLSLLETRLHDMRLNELDAWSDAGWEPGAVLACRRAENLFVAAGADRTVRRDGRSTVDALAVPDGFAECRVESRHRGSGVASPTAACRGTMGCRREGRYMRVVVDIAENRVVGWYDSQMSAQPPGFTPVAGARMRMSGSLLFSGADRLLLQQDISIRHPDGPTAFKSGTGPLLRAVDTRTGRVLTEYPEGATGKVARVFCAGKAERTVLAGDGQVHLVDLDTLDTIASAPIPFSRPYFVF